MRRESGSLFIVLFGAFLSASGISCNVSEIAKSVVVREAVESDAPAIFQIARQNRLEIDQQSIGFLVGDQPLEYYQKFIDHSQGTVLVATINQVVTAFVTSADSLRSIAREERRDHITAGLAQKLRAREPHLKFILQVAVSPPFKGMGLATQLYAHLFSKFPRHYWATSIVESPPQNRPSVSFHKRMGFTNFAHADSPHTRLGTLNCGFYYREPGPYQAP